MTTTPQPAGRYADGVYDHNAPGLAGYAAVQPGASSNEERLVALALQRDAAPVALRDAPRAAFPDRFTGRPRTELTIGDVVRVDRYYPDNSAAFSQTSGGYSGSTAPSMGYW